MESCRSRVPPNWGPSRRSVAAVSDAPWSSARPTLGGSVTHRRCSSVANRTIRPAVSSARVWAGPPVKRATVPGAVTGTAGPVCVKACTSPCELSAMWSAAPAPISTNRDPAGGSKSTPGSTAAAPLDDTPPPPPSLLAPRAPESCTQPCASMRSTRAPPHARREAPRAASTRHALRPIRPPHATAPSAVSAAQYSSPEPMALAWPPRSG